jgi:hypothetical protein
VSFQAVSWAARQTSGGPTGKLVLMMLAQFADDEGVCFPGQLKLAEMCELTDRAVREWLAKLEAKGLISRARRYRPGGYRTSDAIVLSVTSQEPRSGKTQQEPRSGENGAKPLDLQLEEPRSGKILPEPRSDLTGTTFRAINSKGNSQREIELDARERSLDEWFEFFWSVYPKRVGGNPKKPARDKFLKALSRGCNPADIVKGAYAYAQLYPEASSFVAHATTWLNQERWSDDYSAQAARGPPMNGVHSKPKPKTRDERTLDVFANLIDREQRKGGGLS